jgi:DNA adenine methylase
VTATTIPGPVVKWAGSKRSSVPTILDLLPKKIRTYYEPFFGGGAVFFALAREGRFERAVISDSNPELVEALRAIRDNVEAVIRAVKALCPGRITAAKYSRIRDAKPRTAATRAARFLFLNHAGFNGLYRVNRSGKFNVPWGKRTSWRVDVENLRSVAALLRGQVPFASPGGPIVVPQVEIRCRDFGTGGKQLDLFNSLGPGDVCYFDPPYLPESTTARFAAYTAGGFSVEDHARLAELFDKLAGQGVFVAASNADVRGTVRLYEGNEKTEFYRLQARRAINSNGKRRGKVGELLMVNPGKPGEVRNDGK